jgi:hypothetical protein
MDNTRHSNSPVPASQSPSETRTASSSSSMEHTQDMVNMGVYLPRPAYQRPISYGQPSPSNCTHCGNLTPRYGTTTVYGTPLKHTPATSTEKFSRFSDRYSVVSSTNPDIINLSSAHYSQYHHILICAGNELHSGKIREVP